MMIIDIEDYLASIDAHHYLQHYGTPRRSGRYPWGSGDDEDAPDKRNKGFLDHIAELKRSGMTDAEVARGLGMESTTQLRAAKSIAKNAQKQADIAFAQRLKEKGCSNVYIGERLGMPESSVRALLAPGVKDRLDILHETASMLKTNVDERGFIDIGTGVENQLGISKEKLSTAVAVLKEQGYRVHTVQVDQMGTQNKTSIKTLCPPGTEYRDLASRKDEIQSLKQFSQDGGRSFLGLHDPLSIDSNRVAVRYGPDGGDKEDGFIYIRPGVKELSMGENRYAQVRIAVDGTHYLKGMAIYKKDLPEGVDILFNTNKADTGNKLDAMKPYKKNKDGTVDKDNPFGSTVRQRIELDLDGNEVVTSALNIVGSKEGAGEEGAWDGWSRNLPSQFLSKQSSQLARGQLNMTYESKRQDLDDILKLTNPSVKKKLLEAYADEVDSSAVHLKAAALPRQSTHVILPIPSIKDTEVYAPNMVNGERVVLVRFPHGGRFELPELTVNNNHPTAKKLLGDAKDAVAISPKVAKKLSGADFDGDTVLVIPNNSGRIQVKPTLEGLKDFDPQRMYPKYEGMKVMDARTKGFEMGNVSNLITDMTIKGATDRELAQAVRHSMVVIDAEKHELNWKQSAIDNGISALKRKYQLQEGSKSHNPGAATLISRANSRKDVRERKLRSAKEGGPIDPATGKKVYVETGEHWVTANGTVKYKTERSTKLAETHDAHTLSSGMPIEKVYADHSNKLKALANEARKATLSVRPTRMDRSATLAYAPEVKALNERLNAALMNRPLERQAQVIANATLSAKRRANPDMDTDTLKKVKFQALAEARMRTGAGKELIEISDSEWDAIQAGAISPSKLKDILDNANLDRVKQLATPRTVVLMTSTKTRRAQTMANQGYSQGEIAAALGVSLTTLKTAISDGG